MSAEDKATAKRIAQAIEALPDSKKEWLLGYAEGVADMKRQSDEAQEKSA